MENNNKIHRDRARHLRKNLATAEQQLWEALRKRQLEGFRFRHTNKCNTAYPLHPLRGKGWGRGSGEVEVRFRALQLI